MEDNDNLSLTNESTEGCEKKNGRYDFPIVIGGQYTPLLAKRIFGMLQLETLIRCRVVSKAWRELIDSQTSLWNQIHRERYSNAVRSGRTDICRLIIAHSGLVTNPKQ